MWKFIDRFGIFFVNFFTALKFAAYDYDVTLQRTKTPKQRIIIWLSIFLVALIVCYLLIFLLKRFIQSVAENRLLQNERGLPIQ